MIQTLGKGFVDLIDMMGGDASVCDAARVLEEKEVIMLQPGDKELIYSMMEGRHGTPFEHTVFKFRIKLPIFVVREWHRHRISSYNEISMRWMKGQPDFYTPSPKNVRRIKEGAKKIDYQYEQVADRSITDLFCVTLDEWHRHSYELYEASLRSGIAPEQARYFLPNTFFTQMIWTVNSRALMNFLSLRNEDHAMWEIREYAKAVEQCFEEVMPITHEAFVKRGRRVP